MKENKGIKKWGFLFVLFMMLFMPSLRVNAEQVLSITGEDSISPGSTISYNIDVSNKKDILSDVLGAGHTARTR